MKKEDLLREIVDNVGKRDTAGQNIQAVVSVAMLSEGWDAKNVTHIMGLRAFTSQLLCEQVIGRGLRRVSYEQDEDGLFISEFVNVFGVPLAIFCPRATTAIITQHRQRRASRSRRCSRETIWRSSGQTCCGSTRSSGRPSKSIGLMCPR